MWIHLFIFMYLYARKRTQCNSQIGCAFQQTCKLIQVAWYTAPWRVMCYHRQGAKRPAATIRSSSTRCDRRCMSCKRSRWKNSHWFTISTSTHYCSQLSTGGWAILVNIHRLFSAIGFGHHLWLLLVKNQIVLVDFPWLLFVVNHCQPMLPVYCYLRKRCFYCS